MTRKRKVEKCHFLRIFLFAEHLSRCRLEDYPAMEYYCDNERMPYILNDGILGFISFPYIYHELAIFAEWDWVPECGIIRYTDPSLFRNTEDAIISFFGITPQQFCKYFLPYGYKGSPLHRNSAPKDVAQGLYELIGITKRFVLIEKFRTQNT
jgi:hypothetical protein